MAIVLPVSVSLNIRDENLDFTLVLVCNKKAWRLAFSFIAAFHFL